VQLSGLRYRAAWSSALRGDAGRPELGLAALSQLGVGRTKQLTLLVTLSY
jgi:hypothetical protein